MIRIIKRYNVYCIDEGLVDYYIGEDSITSDPEKLYIACNKILTLHPKLKVDNLEVMNSLVDIMKGDLKSYVINNGEDYIKYAKWIIQNQKTIKNFIIYGLSVLKIYPKVVHILNNIKD